MKPICRLIAVTTLLLLLLCLTVIGQSSPNPVITDFDGTALNDTLFPGNDSAFCKGSEITLHGQYFKRAQGGESWDTTLVWLGSYPGGTKATVTGIVQGNGGLNDRLSLLLPDVFIEDTCLILILIKKTSIGVNTYTYIDTVLVCLTGDYARISYGDTIFCVGDSNPLPNIQLSSGTSGAFCCESGASGFIVLPSGEIPLHGGAVGLNSFQYRTSNTFCADTLSFQIDISPSYQSVATYSGTSTFPICQNVISLTSDTVNLSPPIRWGLFSDPTGNLVILNDTTGLIDVAASTPGTHILYYLPLLPCYDTATVSITILSPATAQIAYPYLNVLNGNPHICQNENPVIPTFLQGSPGGTFYSVPAGVQFGGLGEILPAASAAGNYDVFYVPPGNCVDTVQVLTSLQIDSVNTVSFPWSSVSFCIYDTIRFDTLAGFVGGNLEILNNGGNVLFAFPLGVFVINNLGIPGGQTFTLRYISPGNCPDTTTVLINVFLHDDPGFYYPSSVYCLGDADPWAVITGNGGGTFQPVTPNTVVSAGGQLNLAGSGPGQHVVRYVTAGSCPDSSQFVV
ncbi:MAG: hypothetical protein L3J79_07800 [Candidatus Marinimicrobia bacterium]|nr:hypothetical protein [Candidatus Neomarinimicrobiota bacterium]